MTHLDTRILIAEDEVRFADALRRGLASDGYAVDVVHDGASALTFLESGAYEILVLDRDLPILHGDIVARTLRNAASHVRVLMLTAAADPSDQVAGLDCGADDYLTKPFDYDVLLARLRALTRRTRTRSGGIEHAGIHLDLRSRQATADDRPIHLRPKEFALLAELVRARGDVISPSTLFDAVWGEMGRTDESVVKTVVHSLRRKLGASRIATVHGAGYRIAE